MAAFPKEVVAVMLLDRVFAPVEQIPNSPAFVYANLLRTGYNWIRAVVLRRDSRFYFHQFHHEWSYIRTSLQIFSRERERSAPAELVHFSRAYIRKRRAARLKHCGA